MPLVAMPKQLEGMNYSEKMIFNKLKQLYMSKPYIVYLYLEPKIKNLNPDFILIDPKRGVLIIEVKAWDLKFIDTINHKEIINSKGEILENPLNKARRYLNSLKKIFKYYSQLYNKDQTLKFKLNSAVIFTELKHKDINGSLFYTFFDHYPAYSIYKDEISKLTLEKLFNNNFAPIESAIIDTIRVAIFPEIKIAKLDTSLSYENIQALDIEQERFAKNLPLGHYMVTGIPGSGKTVMLISRAIYLAKRYPKWKILILTYNKLLSSQLKVKIEKLKKQLKVMDINIDNIEINTFHSLAKKLSKLPSAQFKNASDKFWTEQLPNIALKNAKPIYNAILIDEYQDFYTNWFKLIKKLLIQYKTNGHNYINLFLAGDRLQSIYNKKVINWKQETGLNMSGRAKLLTTSYRISKEHIELGLYILKKDKVLKEEVDKFYNKAEYILLKNKQNNSIDIFKGDNEKIANYYKNLLKYYDYSDILLLAPTWQKVKEIKNLLPLEMQNKIISSKKFIYEDAVDKSIFTTFHSSKGIETKVVFIVDTDNIKPNERKLFYVASTRASHKLIIHYQKNSEIIENIFEYLAQNQANDIKKAN